VGVAVGIAAARIGSHIRSHSLQDGEHNKLVVRAHADVEPCDGAGCKPQRDINFINL
jgi:hypothetical protein